MPISLFRRVFAVLFVLFAAVAPAAGESGVKLKKVVLDAGHGGKDPGSISKDRKLYEKTVALDVTLMLGELITKAYPDVEVVYTRDKDIFIPLYQRPEIANKCHADLFISIHCNSVDNRNAEGFETYVMGMNGNAANMAVCKRENSVILLEDDYSTRYQGFDPNDSESYIMFSLMQNAHFEQSLILADLCQKAMVGGPIAKNRGVRQAGLVVLWGSTMPSVLVEIGFISNDQDRAVLASKGQRKKIAGELFTAFKKYKEQYEDMSGDEKQEEVKPEEEAMTKDEMLPGEETLPAEPEAPMQENKSDEPAKETVTAPEESSPSGNFFAVQIFAVSKNLKPGAPEFKGEKPVHKFKTGNVFKYTIGEYKTQQEASAAASRISKKFPGCFVVKIDNFEIKKK
ncbi:MAG: N-acetylmuramoyl-L-alanine amidase [Bacteroidales bacterium]|nr:N-acetylmuramoyl-L-alanine amidase [Bacteroidales bacterium]